MVLEVLRIEERETHLWWYRSQIFSDFIRCYPVLSCATSGSPLFIKDMRCQGCTLHSRTRQTRQYEDTRRGGETTGRIMSRVDEAAVQHFRMPTARNAEKALFEHDKRLHHCTGSLPSSSTFSAEYQPPVNMQVMEKVHLYSSPL